MYADGSLAICDDFAKQLNHLHHTAVGVSQTLQDDVRSHVNINPLLALFMHKSSVTAR